jgi:hypothetical protein
MPRWLMAAAISLEGSCAPPPLEGRTSISRKISWLVSSTVSPGAAMRIGIWNRISPGARHEVSLQACAEKIPSSVSGPGWRSARTETSSPMMTRPS